jgi:hypothetical protein
MDSEAPIGEIRRGFRHWRRVALILAAVPIFGLLLGYAVFASSWTSDWLAKKIQARVGLETRIGGISWSPWSAAEIRDLEFLQPKPLQALENWQSIVHSRMASMAAGTIRRAIDSARQPARRFAGRVACGTGSFSRSTRTAATGRGTSNRRSSPACATEYSASTDERRSHSPTRRPSPTASA